jgi:uncharacterized coiled-coil protein SlyX
VRVDEIVRRHLGDGGRVIVPRTAREFIIPGTLPDGTMVDATEDPTAVSAAEQGDVVLLALGDNPATADFLELLSADSIAVLVLTVPPEKLPVGAVLEALHASRTQVLDAVAVQHSKPAVAVVAGRPKSVMLPAAYLSRDVGEAYQDGALRRIVGEWVLESFVRRAETHLAEAEAKRSADERSNLQQTVAARDETIDRLNNELAASQSRLAERQRRVEALEGSRLVRLGRTVSRRLRHVRWWRHVRNPTNSS